MEASNDTYWRGDKADGYLILLCTFELSGPGVELAEWPDKEDGD